MYTIWNAKIHWESFFFFTTIGIINLQVSKKKKQTKINTNFKGETKKFWVNYAPKLLFLYKNSWYPYKISIVNR